MMQIANTHISMNSTLDWKSCLNQTDATHREKYLKTAWGKRYVKTRLKNYLTG